MQDGADLVCWKAEPSTGAEAISFSDVTEAAGLTPFLQK
jgi:hypothetical protein